MMYFRVACLIRDSNFWASMIEEDQFGTGREIRIWGKKIFPTGPSRWEKGYRDIGHAESGQDYAIRRLLRKGYEFCDWWQIRNMRERLISLSIHSEMMQHAGASMNGFNSPLRQTHSNKAYSPFPPARYRILALYSPPNTSRPGICSVGALILHEDGQYSIHTAGRLENSKQIILKFEAIPDPEGKNVLLRKLIGAADAPAIVKSWFDFPLLKKALIYAYPPLQNVRRLSSASTAFGSLLPFPSRSKDRFGMVEI